MKEMFLLKDESMTPRFELGDRIEVDTEADINNGDPVVALDDEGKVIMRRFFHKNDTYLFQPINTNYEPIVCTSPTIVGKVVRLYRTM